MDEAQWTAAYRVALRIFGGVSSKIISVYSLALLKASLQPTIPHLWFPKEYCSPRLNIRLLKLLSAGLWFYLVIHTPKYTGEARLKAVIKNLFGKKKIDTRKTMIFLQTEKGLKKMFSAIGSYVIPELKYLVINRQMVDLHHF